MVEFNWSSKCSKLRSQGPVIQCGFHDTLKIMAQVRLVLHRVVTFLSIGKTFHLLVLDPVNISNSQHDPPRVSSPIFCPETLLGLRKQEFNRNHKLEEETRPCGSEEAKAALSGFYWSCCVAESPLPPVLGQPLGQQSQP